MTDLTNVFVDPTAYADEERFHAACRVLRRERPIARVESERYRPFWVVTRHADVELAATGERSRKRTVDTVNDLTPQETQITRLAALCVRLT